MNIFSVGPCLMTVALFCSATDFESHILTGHSLIVDFCRRLESLYGEDCCTPNMHMACHLKD